MAAKNEKEKLGNALFIARKHIKLKYVLPVALILVAFFLLCRIADRQINGHLPAAIDYLQKTSGLRFEIQRLEYRFPTGVRAHKIRISHNDGREWFHAASMTAEISPFRYLVNRKVGRHLIRTVDAQDLKVSLYHQKTGGWEFPEIRRSAKNVLSGTASQEARINLNIDNLTINFCTEEKTTSHSYRTMNARVCPTRGLDSIDVAGDNERFHLSIKRDSGDFDLKADSFGLAILSTLLGDTIPLNDLHITARAQGENANGKEMSILVSGTVEHFRKKTSLLSPLDAKAVILRFNATGSKNVSRTSIRNGQISLGGESLFVDGWFSNAEHPEIKMVLSFPEFSIGKAISTLPRSFHPDFSDFKVNGKVAGKLHFFMDMARPRSLTYHFEGKYEPVTVLSLGSKINVNNLKSSFRHTVRTCKGEKIEFLVGEDNSQYAPIQDIPPSLISAVITSEDAGFFFHKGFSQKGIKDSFAENLEAGRIVRGASTISMQLAKNLFLTRERTFSRKFEETFITMALEQNLSKERIMEIYLNIIEWGDGIYGIGPAAHFYFSKAPKELKPLESAFLASIIARPTKNWKTDPLNSISEGWWKYLHVILCKMYERGGAEMADLREAGVPETRIRALVKGNEQDGPAPFSEGY